MKHSWMIAIVFIGTDGLSAIAGSAANTVATAKKLYGVSAVNKVKMPSLRGEFCRN